ncbi:radical SAM protein [bacterium]
MVNGYEWKYIYGPVYSWRLGRSLGIDLLSQKEKICNFNCIYCQIGNTENYCTRRKIFVPTEKILDEVKRFPDVEIDYITFSGRGEPTLAKNLGEVIERVKKLRKNKIAVITNSSLIHKQTVRKELALADTVMAKCDVSCDIVLKKINKPAPMIVCENIVEGLTAFRRMFDGELKLQIMFVHANMDTVHDMISLVRLISPASVEINTPLRPSHEKSLDKEKIMDIKTEFKVLEKDGIKILSVYDQPLKKMTAVDRYNTLIRRGKEV